MRELLRVTTPVGDAFRSSRARVALAALIGAAAIGLDFVYWPVLRLFTESWHTSLGFGALVVLGWTLPLVLLARFDRASLGLRWTPLQGWTYWIKAAFVLGAIVLFAGVVAFIALPPLGFGPVELPATPPEHFWYRLPRAVIKAPLLEEGIYRLVFCTAVVAVLRPWPTIAISGVVFGLLHFQYGNPGPDNFIAGYLFAWAYLKSGSIAIPVILHAIGNLIVVLASLGAYYLAL